MASGNLFQKGHKKLGGRRKGSKNLIQRGSVEFCQALIDDPKVQAAMRRRALRGNERVWKFAHEVVHGKPRQSVALTGEGGGPVRLERIERVIVDERNAKD